MTDTTQDPRDAKVAELQAKLTEAERLNNVALDAMKNASKYPEYDSRHDEYRHCCCNAKSNKPHLETCYINNAIKEIEGAMPTRHRREWEMNAPVMSMFANELDCLRARDKYHTDRIAELEGLKRQLKITKARLFKAQAEFETMALHATTLEQANTRLTAHIKQIAAKHDVQRHDNYGNSYLVDLHETFCDFALSIFTKENHEATTD